MSATSSLPFLQAERAHQLMNTFPHQRIFVIGNVTLKLDKARDYCHIHLDTGAICD